MSLVSAHNEWDPLEHVVIGTVDGARIPTADRGLFAVEFSAYGDMTRIPSGPYAQQIVEETEAELDALSTGLRELGIEVSRPQPRNTAGTVATPDWRTDGFYDYCPRDVLLTIGDTVLETPMVLRSRFLEPFAYKEILLRMHESGARWISAPKPRLTDDMYRPDAPAGQRLGDLEPAFDAANVLRFGTDILYLVSDTGNEKGWRWLQSTLGGEYTVWPCRDVYAHTHVDSTIVPLRPGLVLLNPERVNERNMPDFLRSWDRIWCPDLVDTGFLGEHAYASTWIGMNLLVIRPGLVVADDRQPILIKALEQSGVDVLPLRLTHSRTLGGSFHCVSLDLRRTGRLETYR